MRVKSGQYPSANLVSTQCKSGHKGVQFWTLGGSIMVIAWILNVLSSRFYLRCLIFKDLSTTSSHSHKLREDVV